MSHVRPLPKTVRGPSREEYMAAYLRAWAMPLMRSRSQAAAAETYGIAITPAMLRLDPPWEKDPQRQLRFQYFATAAWAGEQGACLAATGSWTACSRRMRSC